MSEQTDEAGRRAATDAILTAITRVSQRAAKATGAASAEQYGQAVVGLAEAYAWLTEPNRSH